MNSKLFPNCIPLEAGSSTGKTTLIKRLRQMGFNCVDEVGTPIIQGGLTPDHGRKVFQDECLRRQFEVEKVTNNSDQLWFLDRGLLIGRAHFIYEGLPIPEAYGRLDTSHYAFVFIVEPLETFEYNGVRPAWEDLEFSKKMTDLVEAEYQSHNIATVRVPRMEGATMAEQVDKRLQFMLAHCRTVFPQNALFQNVHCGSDSVSDR